MKNKSFGFSDTSMRVLDDEITSTKIQLDSYKDFVKGERERLNVRKNDIVLEITTLKSEFEAEASKTITSNFSLRTDDNIEELRKQLAETSIKLEENRD